jgi:UDP-N-acetylglucosamine diphosphorylase/glucosamine-1-phosphate N-acetyltransferase
MRVVLFDEAGEKRRNFYPIALSRPIWDLRCGITSLAEKLLAKAGATEAACWVPSYMATYWKSQTAWSVNDPASLKGSDLLLLNPRMKAEGLDKVDRKGASQVGLGANDEILYAVIRSADLAKLDASSIDTLLASAKKSIPSKQVDLATWNYTWDLVLASPHQITHDFNALGKTGVEGTIEQPSGFRGNKKDLFIGQGAVIHPMAVIDCANGPVFLDEGVEVHPFTRIEGPCFVGKKSILLGAKCREGNSIGTMCRVGGEVEESIIHSFSNKYHDGFLGHAYVGQWVNLGAQTTNSDLKNDYGSVEVVLDGKRGIDTGSTKVGALIGDHTKTSIGTLFNTGAYVGAMCLIMTTGKPLSKYIPDFSWLIDGNVTKGFGKAKLYATAKTAKGRRKQVWTEDEQAMWESIYELTSPQRDEAIKKGRRQMMMK